MLMIWICRSHVEDHEAHEAVEYNDWKEGDSSFLGWYVSCNKSLGRYCYGSSTKSSPDGSSDHQGKLDIDMGDIHDSQQLDDSPDQEQRKNAVTKDRDTFEEGYLASQGFGVEGDHNSSPKCNPEEKQELKRIYLVVDLLLMKIAKMRTMKKGPQRSQLFSLLLLASVGHITTLNRYAIP